MPRRQPCAPPKLHAVTRRVRHGIPGGLQAGDGPEDRYGDVCVTAATDRDLTTLAGSATPPTLADVERTQIVAALHQIGWRVRGSAAHPLPPSPSSRRSDSGAPLSVAPPPTCRSHSDISCFSPRPIPSSLATASSRIH